MKQLLILSLTTLALIVSQPIAQAQLTIPSDGSDGALDLAASPAEIVIDLSQAVDAAWNVNNAPNAGRGVYDLDQWAIVFKYSSVTIPAGVRVSFRNHRSRAPVVWLVQGNVVINGELNLDGGDIVEGVAALTPVEGGPGGFRGGPFGPQGEGSGLGPGGGVRGVGYGAYAGSYGNPLVTPLIGGSGGRGNSVTKMTGGGGGGSILIAAAGDVAVNGRVLARGGSQRLVFDGSGGAVRIIASSVIGSGEINCLDDGRIRVEASSLAASIRTFPETIAVPPATPPLIWPPAGAPSVRIISVDTLPAPADPTAPLVSSADVAIQNDSPVAILLETKNFPLEGIVQVRIAQKWGRFDWVRAAYVSGNQSQAQWRATTTFVKGYSTLQARATAP